MVQQKHCPRCGSAMAFRLGTYDCPQCEFSEPAAAEPLQSAPPQDYGGVRRARLLVPPESAVQPDPASTLQQAATHGAGFFQRGVVPPSGLHGYVEPELFRQRTVNEALDVEKHVYYSITVISVVGSALFQMLMLSAIPPLPYGSPRSLLHLALLLAAALVLGLYWIVIYSSWIFAKWGCIGLTGLFMLVTVIAGLAFMLNSEWWELLVFNTAGLGAAYIVISFLLQLGWNAWLISILYRDIQRIEQ